MADNEGMTRIDPESPVYQEVARLYGIAQEMRPGGQDLWNGELYARNDDKWGGLTRDGTFRLNETLVLDQLTGGAGTDRPELQGQAVATVLHESLHARVVVDAPNEPNAVRAGQSIALDEGLTELAAMEDYAGFAQRAGYEDAQKPDPEYAGAVHAAGELLDRASSSDTDRAELLDKALDQPVVMRWDTVADNIVRNELADTVPPDAEHQQAARAHLVNQMAVGEWNGVQNRQNGGPLVADLTNESVDRAVTQLRDHYQTTPNDPYPAKTPNPAAEVATPHPEQQRAATQAVDLTTLPPPDATTRLPDTQPQSPQPNTQEAAQPTPSERSEGAESTASESAPSPSGPPEGAQSTASDRSEGAQSTASTRSEGAQPGASSQTRSASAQQTAQPAAQLNDPMRFLNNQAPAAHATRPGPSLGDGARGAGAPTGPSTSRPTPDRTPTPDRGGRD